MPVTALLTRRALQLRLPAPISQITVMVSEECLSQSERHPQSNHPNPPNSAPLGFQNRKLAIANRE